MFIISHAADDTAKNVETCCLNHLFYLFCWVYYNIIACWQSHAVRKHNERENLNIEQFGLLSCMDPKPKPK